MIMPRFGFWQGLVSACLLVLVLFGTSLAVWVRVRSSTRVTPAATPLSPEADRGPSVVGPLRFADVTESSGLDFRHRNGEEAGLRYILETLGGGVALLDYDSDGRLDVFVTGGGRFFKSSSGVGVQGWPNGLFRNEGGWRFRDVTIEAGLGDPCGYTHGVAVGDYDNDGDPDLLVTAYEGAVLFRNESGRRFVDVTAEVGLHAPGWSTSAAWADYDNDGWLDLYVGRYVEWSPATNPPCRYRETGPEVVDVCSPTVFPGLSESIYRNRGGETFVDVSRSVGLRPESKALGVVACDIDGDGDVDIYAANDTYGNCLYENRGDGTFAVVPDSSGATLSADGLPLGSMGVDAADIDADGDLDLWVTNYEGETNELFRNDRGTVYTPARWPWDSGRSRVPWWGGGRAWSTSTTTVGSTASSSTATSCTAMPARRRPSVHFSTTSGPTAGSTRSARPRAPSSPGTTRPEAAPSATSTVTATSTP